jgi:hypothetical protein
MLVPPAEYPGGNRTGERHNGRAACIIGKDTRRGKIMGRRVESEVYGSPEQKSKDGPVLQTGTKTPSPHPVHNGRDEEPHGQRGHSHGPAHKFAGGGGRAAS